MFAADCDQRARENILFEVKKKYNISKQFCLRRTRVEQGSQINFFIIMGYLKSYSYLTYMLVIGECGGGVRA